MLDMEWRVGQQQPNITNEEIDIFYFYLFSVTKVQSTQQHLYSVNAYIQNLLVMNS